MPGHVRKSKQTGISDDSPDSPNGRVSVVVVDDRATNRSILAKLARELAEHVEVSTYGDANEALEAVIGNPPDLLITDYKMPDLNGAEFVRRLRDEPKAFDVPVIVVTAYEDKQFRYDALQAGASDFLLTPVDRLEFVQRGRNLLTMRRQQQQLNRQARARERRLQKANRLRERELRFSEEKFSLVINTLPALVSAVDTQGKLAFVNAYQANFCGVDPADATGADLESVFPADYANRHAKANAKVLETGEPLGFEEMVETRDGAQMVFLTSKAPLVGSDGEIANVVTVSVDISERKRAERELAAAKDEAQQANRAKTEFLANISHELRTPLNAVLGFADVARRELLGPIGQPQYREYQEDIYSSATHLLRLIDDLLDLSRLELGRLETRPESVDVAAVVEQEIRNQQDLVEQNGATLTYEVAEEAMRFETDPVRLRQILTNLLSNAVKYTAEGGAVSLQVGRSPSLAGLRFVVADDGPGMDSDELQVAMSRFGRLGRATTHQRPGAGLGLPIASDLTRLLGGMLEIDSARGRGTRIIVDLPDFSAPAADEGGAEATAQAVGEARN